MTCCTGLSEMSNGIQTEWLQSETMFENEYFLGFVSSNFPANVLGQMTVHDTLDYE